MFGYIYNLFLKLFYPKQYKQLCSPNNSSFDYTCSKSNVLRTLTVAIKQYYSIPPSNNLFQVETTNLASLQYNVAYNKFLANAGHVLFNDRVIKQHMDKYPVDDMGVICKWIDMILKEEYDKQIKYVEYNRTLSDKIKTYYK
jgi:hypothetical protein